LGGLAVLVAKAVSAIPYAPLTLDKAEMAVMVGMAGMADTAAAAPEDLPM
jgi:hypothetical protein